MRKKLSFFFLLGLSVVLVSCNKDKTVAPEVNPLPGPTLTPSLSGFGAHGGVPSGSIFVLPSNVKQIGEIYGGLPGKSFTGSKTSGAWESFMSTMPKSSYVEHGIGEYVNLYMKLHNTSPNPTSFVFPAGLVFTNKSLDDSTVIDTAQTGLIVIPDTITIPGGDTSEILLKSFCTNLNHHAPGATSIYMMKVVTNNDQLNSLIGALNTKSKTILINHLGEIQSFVWKITNNTGILQADLDAIRAW